MHKILIILTFIVSGRCFPAFDNTMNNDFWDTTAYVNPMPSSAAKSMAAAFDSRVASSTVKAMPAGETFDSMCFSVTERVTLDSRFMSTPVKFIFVIR